MKIARLGHDILSFLGRTDPSFKYVDEQRGSSNRFRPKRAQRVEILRLEGDLDENGVNDLRLALLESFRNGNSNIIINLAEVSYVSYLGIGALLERLQMARANHGDLVLVGPNLCTLRFIQMIGLTSVFSIYDSEDKALQHFGLGEVRAAG